MDTNLRFSTFKHSLTLLSWTTFIFSIFISPMRTILFTITQICPWNTVKLGTFVISAKIIPMLGTYDRLCFGEFVGGIGCTPMSRGCLAVRGCMVGTLVIGSYIYHSDVIVTSTQIYVNRIQYMSHLFFTSLLHIQTSIVVTMFLRYLVVCCVDSGEFRTKTLIQWWPLLYIVKDNGVPG